MFTKKSVGDHFAPAVLKNLVYRKKFFPHFFVRFMINNFFNIDILCSKEKEIICRYHDGMKGAFCLSVDFDLPSSHSDDTIQIFREASWRLLESAEHSKIPISWGICGKYAREYFEASKKSSIKRVRHDIGIHTYDHIDLSREMSKKVVIDDFVKAIKAIEETNSSSGSPKTFIFPWNRVNHLDILKELGFTSYRGGGSLSKISPPVYDNSNGLWNIYQSYYLNEKSLEKVEIIRNLIDLSVLCGGVFHLWTHPWNLHSNGDVQRFIGSVIQPLFNHIVEQRQEKNLWTCTMRDLAAYSEAKRNCRVEKFTETEKDINFELHLSPLDKRFSDLPLLSFRIALSSDIEVLRVLIDGRDLDAHSWWIKKEENCLVFSIPFSNDKKKIQVIKSG